MKAKSGPRKETGLLYGDISKIARIHRVSLQHVREVAINKREGRPALLETIRRYQEKAKAALTDSGRAA